jgi:hypothetical protein
MNRPIEHGISRASLQFRDLGGNWRTIAGCDADPQRVSSELKVLAQRYRNGVRAVDGSGRLLDILA